MKRIVKLLSSIGSTEGEDKILLTILPDKGKYLDIGCSSPIKDSNTFLLYLNGWNGICIDIRKIRRFKWIRPRDKFIQRTITDIYEFKDYDLLNIDIDGIDLDILKTMIFYPRWICTEVCLPSQKKISEYLKSLSYRMIAKTIRNEIYQQ